jgi:threonine dehydrogenase-like Zn-dependent dehydrogenase
MRQLTCVKPGQLEWHDVPAPALASDHAALVRPIAVARCDIDLFLSHGLLPAKQAFAIGHECVAEIVELGAAVRGLEIGQRAVVSFQLSCGTCGACRAGRSAICEAYPLLSDYGMQPLSGVEYGGMLSDLVSVPHASAMLQPVSKDVDPVALASASDNILDGYRAVAPHLAQHPKSDVLVVSHGYPSIPLYAAQAAIALGAKTVDFASDNDEQLALAERLGARPLRTDFKTRDRQYPIVAEGGLRRAGLEFAIRSTAPEGICQSVSYFERDLPLPVGSMYTRGIRFFIGRAHSASLLPEVVPLIASGKLRSQDVATRVVGAEEAPAAWLEPALKLVVKLGS